MRVVMGALVARLLAFAFAFAFALAASQATSALAGDPDPSAPTPVDRARILALGPWPPASAHDARNPASASPQGIALGEALFHSTRLSDAGGVRCASCHEPWRRFTDGRPRAFGVAEGARNTPTLLDAAAHRRFGWDGAIDELAQQSLRPLRDAREMPADAAHVAALLRGDADLGARVASVFGTTADAGDDAFLRDAGLALAAYVETLVSARTPFDAWRDALATGDATPGAAFPPAAARGLRVFVGRGGCVACHAGPAFTDDAFHVSTIRSVGPDGAADAGRPTGPPNAFRTPGLREVAATAPYMHDGSVATLCDAVLPHAIPDDAAAAAVPLGRDDRRDLVAFLSTLAVAGDASPPACAPR